MVNKKYDHWYEYVGEYIKDAMKSWGLAAVIVGVGLSFAWQYGGSWVETKMRVDSDMAAAYKINAETNKSVADAVTRLTAIADQSVEFQKIVSQQHQELQDYVMANGEAVHAVMKDGTIPAREVRDMMEAATKLMSPLPALREREAKATEALLEIQHEVLQTLKDQSKNALTPPTPNDGGA